MKVELKLTKSEIELLVSTVTHDINELHGDIEISNFYAPYQVKLKKKLESLRDKLQRASHRVENDKINYKI